MKFAVSGVITILCEILLISGEEFHWLSIGQADGRSDIITKKWCKSVPGLAPKQRKICKDHIESMPAIISATRLTIKACRLQMADRDWNCTVDSSGRFATTPKAGSRESALMHAFGSSAIAFTLAKYCSSGLIANCECDESEGFDDVVSAFEWSACSDNVVNGVAFAEAFMKSWDLKSWRTKRHLEIQRKGARWRQLTKILTNLRNNAAGTNVLYRSIRKRCMCHGTSASCGIVTCWKSLPAYAVIAKTLKNKYDKAVQVKVLRHHSQQNGFQALNPTQREIKKSDLIFFRNPKKLCDTKGRKCHPNSFGLGSCSELCCGRGYQSQKQKIFKKCRCRFVNCCKVDCDSCESSEIVYICK